MREPIEAHKEWNSYFMSDNCCAEPEVRELELYTADLERKLKIAEEALEEASDHPDDITKKTIAEALSAIREK